MTTLSIIKADTGGYVGHSAVHPEQIATAQEAVARGLLTDGQVASCGDDISLIMTHGHGVDAEFTERPSEPVIYEIPVGGVR